MTTLKTECLINGDWIDTDRTFTVSDPATDEHITEVADGREAEASRAIDAASRAFPAWRATPAAERASVLRRLAELIERDVDRLARLMTREQGKPLGEAAGETRYSASFFRSAADEAEKLGHERLHNPIGEAVILAVPEPVGVCAAITPWNFPSAMLARKMAPALAAGCTMVARPASETPLSALALGELAMEAGVPPGVLNIVTGDAATFAETVFGDPRVRKVSFTGSTRVGKLLMRRAAENVVRLSLELGGLAPFLVFEDADLDSAVDGLIASKFRNAGQTCICPNRVYVQHAVKEAFVAKLVEAASSLRVGRGTDDGVDIGPLISDRAVAKVEGHVHDAIGRGGEIHLGGERVEVPGATNRFYAPTVVDGLTRDMLLSKEETFGPVVPVGGFDGEDEAVALANDSEFGLAAYIYTRDVERGARVAGAIEAGIVGVNNGAVSNAYAPFGGVKQSGFGREGGRWALREYTNIKYVSRGP